jgi:osmotically-inducible protein OsmY
MKVKVFTLTMLAVALLLSACGKSDSDLQKAVADKLAAEGVTGVTVTVNDGVATLSGEVADITVKNKAEAAAKVEGIKSVNNQISLRALPTPSPAPADPMLKGKVDEALRKAGCTGAVAEVSGGTVILKGTVPAAKFAECVRVAQESGATKVENQLQKGS